MRSESHESVGNCPAERRSFDLSVVDALRGLAALSVVMYHLNDWYFPRLGLTAIEFNYGYLGVQFFCNKRFLHPPPICAVASICGCRVGGRCSGHLPAGLSIQRLPPTL
jgi:hypothetical protein